MIDNVITSLLGSLFPILITLLVAWVGNRTEQTRRKKILDDAKQRIELINSYVASQKLVINDSDELGIINKTAANELYGIKAFLDKSLQSFEKSSEKSESFFLRFFLLYQMRTTLAKFFRFCFFISLFVSLFWSIAITAVTVFSPEKVQAHGLGIEIIAVITLALPVVIVALSLRWLAIKFDKPETSTNKS